VNGVFNESRWKAGVFYVLAGGGVTFEIGTNSAASISLDGGTGDKNHIVILAPRPRAKLGMAIVHLIDPKDTTT